MLSPQVRRDIVSGNIANLAGKSFIQNYNDGPFSNNCSTIRLAIKSNNPAMVGFVIDNGARVVGDRIEDFDDLLFAAVDCSSEVENDNRGLVVKILLDNFFLEENDKKRAERLCERILVRANQGIMREEAKSFSSKVSCFQIIERMQVEIEQNDRAPGFNFSEMSERVVENIERLIADFSATPVPMMRYPEGSALARGTNNSRG